VAEWGLPAHRALMPPHCQPSTDPPCASTAPLLQGERRLCLRSTSTQVAQIHALQPQSTSSSQNPSSKAAWLCLGCSRKPQQALQPPRGNSPDQAVVPHAHVIILSEQMQVLQKPDGFVSPLRYKLLPARFQGKDALSVENNIYRLENKSPWGQTGRGEDSLGRLQDGTEELGEHRSGKSSGETDIPLSTSSVYLSSLSQALAPAFSNPQLNE